MGSQIPSRRVSTFHPAKHASLCTCRGLNMMYLCTSAHNRTGWDRIKNREKKIQTKKTKRKKYWYILSKHGWSHSLEQVFFCCLLLLRKEEMRSVHRVLVFFPAFFFFLSLCFFIRRISRACLHSLSRSKSFCLCDSTWCKTLFFWYRCYIYLFCS